MQRVSMFLAMVIAVSSSTVIFGQRTLEPRIGPSRGALILDGGPEATPVVARRFSELAGGDAAKIVVIPSAAGDEFAHAPSTIDAYRKLFGRGCCTILHTSLRAVGDRADFVAPLASATGVWLTGGDPSRLSDTYWHTATERALRALLGRGGVVGGSSAGAIVQGSQMPTRHPDEGFAFLRNVIVMPHLNRGKARDMLVGAIAGNGSNIGIGVPENTAAIVTGDRLEVVGEGDVVIADGRSHDGKPYRVARPGERVDLAPRSGSGLK